MELQEAFDAGFEAVKNYVDHALGTVETRINALESMLEGLTKVSSDDTILRYARKGAIEGAALAVETIRKQFPALKDGRDGKDGVPGLNGKDGAPGANGKDGLNGLNGKDGAPGRDGVDGKNGIDGKPGADGRDGMNGKDADPELIREFAEAAAEAAVKRAIAALPAPQDGRDGKDADMGMVSNLVAQEVRKAVSEIPPPAKGERGDPGHDGKDGKDGRDGLHGKDGTNGRDGKDGSPGLNGKDGSPGQNGKDAELPADWDFRDFDPENIFAPEAAANMVAKAVTLLAESVPVTAPEYQQVKQGTPKPRKTVVQRDAQNRIVSFVEVE